MAVLDSNIAGLMNQTVTWESASSQNLYGDTAYAAPKVITCFIEEKGYSGGAKSMRRSDDSVTDAYVALYFDANNADVATFSVNDRFTVSSGTDALGAISTQPDSIDVFVGPQGERWITVVTL